MLGKSQAEPKLHGLPEGFRGCLKESQLILKIRGGGAILKAAGWEETLCRAQEWKSAEPCCKHSDQEKVSVGTEMVGKGRRLQIDRELPLKNLCETYHHGYCLGAPF